MDIEIFYHDKQLLISSTRSCGFEIIVDQERAVSLEEILQLFEYHNAITLRCDDVDESYRKFASQLTQVTAAGGVVKSTNDTTLMIHRNGRWDLPKGHLEVGESLEECAVREVKEETGVSQITIGTKICETIHIYTLRGKWEIKTTHWYNMTSPSCSHLTPQREEGIEQVEWLTKRAVKDNIPHSYKTIQRVIGALR